MKSKYFFPFDPKIVPWETTPEEWYSFVLPEPYGRIWVECLLIVLMNEANLLNREAIDGMQGLFAMIGDKIAASSDQPDSEDNVQSITFVGFPIEVRVGTFSGKLFVFSPRPEYGWNAERN